MTLWHYTCSHGRARIGDRGVLLPACLLTERATPRTGLYVWLTDLSVPIRDALGLTRYLVECDRIAHRYRVLDSADAVRWPVVARTWPFDERVDLESAPGARPAHWYVSTEPVPVEVAP